MTWGRHKYLSIASLRSLRRFFSLINLQLPASQISLINLQPLASRICLINLQLPAIQRIDHHAALHVPRPRDALQSRSSGPHAEPDRHRYRYPSAGYRSRHGFMFDDEHDRHDIDDRCDEDEDEDNLRNGDSHWRLPPQTRCLVVGAIDTHTKRAIQTGVRRYNVSRPCRELFACTG